MKIRAKSVLEFLTYVLLCFAMGFGLGLCELQGNPNPSLTTGLIGGAGLAAMFCGSNLLMWWLCWLHDC